MLSAASFLSLWGQWLARWAGFRATLTRLWPGLWPGLWARQADRIGLWSPICLASGIGLFFLLPQEPPPWTLASPLVAGGLLFFLRRRATALVLGSRAIFLVGIGFAAAQGQSLRTAPAALPFPLPAAWYSAQVVAVEQTGTGHRVTLAHLGRAGAAVPEIGDGKLRLRGQTPEPPPVGSWIAMRAVLTPVILPLIPGGFDLRLTQFFEGIVAHGTLYAFRILDPGTPPPWLDWRQSLSTRIRDIVPGRAGKIAVALAVGDQTGVAEPVRLAMRNSGLTHILSISGLHIGLLAALVTIAVRRGMALVPAIALRIDAKKLAVWPTAILVVLYGVLAGWDVPVQRSVLMTGVVLLAILLDRTPLTLRTVAVAAFLVLLGSPQALLNPGFQMSFATVIALISAHERFAPWFFKWRAAYGGSLTPIRIFVASILTSLIATLATAPFTAHHFHMIALYGVIANLLAIPLTGLIIMPGILFGFLLLPFGLDAWGWQSAGWGIDGLILLAEAVAALPGAAIPVPQISGTLLLLIVVGGLWICLWRGALSWGGTLLLLAAGLLAGLTPAPLFLSSGRDPVIALRRPDGIVEIFGAAPENLPSQALARLLRSALGAEEGIVMGGPGSLATCDPWGCRFPTKHGVLAFQRHPAALDADCRDVWGVVTAAPLRIPCAKPAWMLSFDQLRAVGPARVRFEGGRIRVEGTRKSGRRWHPPMNDPALPGGDG